MIDVRLRCGHTQGIDLQTLPIFPQVHPIRQFLFSVRHIQDYASFHRIPLRHGLLSIREPQAELPDGEGLKGVEES
jgi:hypothetical protein